MKLISLSLFLAISIVWVGAGEKPKLILDADTANEIDDLYAIARVLNQDRFEVIALNSAQWFHYMGGERSVYASQVINRDLLEILDRREIPALLGADEPMGKPWGGTDAKPSPAADFIIEQALAMPEGEKLIVASLGATTNLASAIKMAPEIAPKIAAYLLGHKYDVEKGIWNKSEFNIRRDLNAADFLLDQVDLELHVMPTTVAIELKFEKADALAKQAEMGALGDYLTKRWEEHSPGDNPRIMWDLALVEAMIEPDSATQKQVLTPPENTQREVWLYDSIDEAGMAEKFWSTVGGIPNE